MLRILEFVKNWELEEKAKTRDATTKIRAQKSRWRGRALVQLGAPHNQSTFVCYDQHIEFMKR
jgi:hypothetical protein